MNKYVIDNDRKVKKTPPSIIEKGTAIFGTFDTSFTNLNLLEIERQLWLLSNKRRLTEWEAFELDFEFGTLVTAVYNNVTLNGMGILIYYDKIENKIYKYRVMTYYKKATIAQNLLNSESYIETKNFKLKIYNDFNNKKASVKLETFNKKNGLFKLEVNIKQFSNSSIVSIPLGKNKPLYSEKAIFTCEGELLFKNKKYNLENALAIIDDHKGYYPYISHYDWLTTMTKLKINEDEILFGFNLTKNQSLNEEKYNENLLWINDKSYILPPVKFIKNKEKWIIKDDYDLVNLEFKIDKTFKMNMHPLIIDVKYSLPFGKISGYIKNNEGDTYYLDNIIGIAEDKTTRI